MQIYIIYKNIQNIQNIQNMQNRHTWNTATSVLLQDGDVGALQLLEIRACLSLNFEQEQYPALPHIVQPQLEPRLFHTGRSDERVILLQHSKKDHT